MNSVALELSLGRLQHSYGLLNNLDRQALTLFYPSLRQSARRHLGLGGVLLCRVWLWLVGLEWLLLVLYVMIEGKSLAVNGLVLEVHRIAEVSGSTQALCRDSTVAKKHSLSQSSIELVHRLEAFHRLYES